VQFRAPRRLRCARGQSPRDEAIEWSPILGSGSDPRPVLEVLLILEEAVHFSLCLVLGAAVALLNLAGKDLGIAVNLIQIVVGELAPLLPDLAFQLFPLSLHGLRVHRPSFGPWRTDAERLHDGCRGEPSPRAAGFRRTSTSIPVVSCTDRRAANGRR